jgi:hypothetical protein
MPSDQSLDPHELNELLDQVVDESTFLVFVEALAADHRMAPRGWQNPTVASFLEAGANWARDSKFGKTQGMGDATPWKRFALFLYCGKIYE